MMKAKDALREILEAMDEVSALHPGENGNTTALIARWKREIDALPDWANIDLDDDEEDDDTGIDYDDDGSVSKDSEVALAAGMRYKRNKPPVSGVMEPGIVNTSEGPKIGTGALLDNQPPYPNSSRGRLKEGTLEDNRKLPDQQHIPSNADQLNREANEDLEESSAAKPVKYKDVIDEKSKSEVGSKNQAPKAK